MALRQRNNFGSGWKFTHRHTQGTSLKHPIARITSPDSSKRVLTSPGIQGPAGPGTHPPILARPAQHTFHGIQSACHDALLTVLAPGQP